MFLTSGKWNEWCGLGAELRIRIRIQVKSRICIKMVWIRNTGGGRGEGVPANDKRFKQRLLELPYFYNMRDGRIEIPRVLATE
jgi:hypothetical protein